ncbi:hypothetical protein NAT51_13050 [Flavobacterium amniphilum]|uniref:hypothetical protein n=1 Tax=Flavobacterium amniphilum TaxID=1834035 RepID=UPI00202A8415|nr:hypothetical protein [Flavobacterium amniphilum]MCL9806458.1 hypothetical protein [Flavobacterium amniphilum]
MKNLALIFSSLIVLLSSCTADSTENQNTVEPTFMSGNINNVNYTNLKPQTYVDAGSFQTVVENYQVTSTLDYNYLLLQGSDVTLTDTPLANSVLINIRIPQSKWAVGTYTIYDEETTSINGTDVVASLVQIGGEKKTESVTGTLTITEFDIASKIVKGTFEFTYMTNNGTALEGPFQLNNGVFKYKLDASYFN